MAEHTDHKEKDLPTYIPFHFSMGKKRKVSNHQFSSLLGLSSTRLLRGQETKEFKLIQLEKLINTFTDLEVRNNPHRRNWVNLEILTTKKKNQ